MFTKSDLKDDDVITYRNGEKRTLKKIYVLIDETGDITNNLDQYTEDLIEKNEIDDIDIVKVERPVKYETVFARKKE